MTGNRAVYTVSFNINQNTGELMVTASDNLNAEAQFNVNTANGQLMTTESDALFSELAFYVSSDNLTLDVQRK